MLRNYTAYFVVEFCLDDKIIEEAGFYPAATFAEAMSYIEEFYGDDLCTVKHLELLDNAMINMTPDTASEIVKYVFG